MIAIVAINDGRASLAVGVADDLIARFDTDAVDMDVVRATVAERAIA